MNDLANALLDLTWSDMDELAAHIYQSASDDIGGQNDERHIAQCLLDFAQEILNRK